MAGNLVKFVYAASATPEQIAAFDSNTIYFIGNPRQIYKGSVLYDGGAADVAADLATLENYIGTLPVEGDYDDLIDYIDKSIAAGDETVTGLVETLENSLADVATSGNAADVAVADSGNHLTATNVEDALAELAVAINDAETAGAVTLTSASGSGDVLTTYTLAQGGTTVGTINIPKDYLVKSATIETADTADSPYQGAEVGDKYIDFVINTKDTTEGSGTAQHIYIALDDLVAVMSGGDTAEISVDIDSHNEITATIVKVSGDKVIYSVGTGGAEDVTVNDKIAELEQALGDGIDALDGSATIATVSNGVVTLKGGVSEVDGVIDNDSSSDIVLAKVATTGAAVDVAYESTTVKAKLDTVGNIPGTATATTVVGYVDEKVGNVVAGLDADLDAALGAGDTDIEAVAVVSGITEVDGVITSVDSVAADAAGAATRAKAAVIGASGDAASADTVYGAKAYADAVVTTAVEDLDADKDATGTAQHAGTFVMSGVTQVDGLITSIDSVEVENAGAAAAAEAAAKAYTDAALTWGSLS